MVWGTDHQKFITWSHSSTKILGHSKYNVDVSHFIDQKYVEGSGIIITLRD